MPLVAQTSATIDVSTTVTTPIHSNFSGVNDEVTFPVEYWVYRLSALALRVGYGWVRFPGGNTGDLYDWQTGEENGDWLPQFAAYSIPGVDTAAIKNVQGKGGGKLIDAANRANLLGAQLIICANGFTDSPDSIGKLAAYVKANRIPVAAWELSNEPYLYAGFFPSGTAYLDKMKPYRDAIKAVDPNAIVAIFVRDPGSATPGQNVWDSAIASYPNKYWDAITFHHYPQQSTGSFAQWMADESAVLASHTDLLVLNAYTPIGPAGVKFLITEFDPSLPNDSKTGNTSITDGTLWGGIYAAEYLMRMSTVPSVLHAGPHSLISFSGVLATNNHISDVQRAANMNTTIDTLSLDFGFYLAAQANGLTVVNGVLNRAVNLNKTTVTGGVSVPATGVAGGIPALYAMSYSTATGALSVVITNKSGTAHQVTIRVNGAAAIGSFPIRFVTGTDPSAVNSPANPNAVAIQSGSSQNPITVPPYSVLRADITVPAVATFANSASSQPGPVAPQQLVTASGAGIASQMMIASSQTLPTTLGSTSISIADSTGAVSAAPILYVSQTEAIFLVPAGVAPGAATVSIVQSGTIILRGTLTIASVAPGIYAANGNGAGVAAATYVRASAPDAAELAFSCQSNIALSCLSTPISLGGAADALTLTLYATGIRGAGSVQAFVAGQTVPVVSMGPQTQYPGLDRVIIALPEALAGTGEASVYLVADGAPSNMTTIYIQ